MALMSVSELQEILDKRSPFAAFLGIRVQKLTLEEVIAELDIRPDLAGAHGVVHGGVLMTLADCLGGAGAYMNLPEGAPLTFTLESKTNFIAAAAVGTTVTARCQAVHRGRRTSIWQTRITNSDGRLVAQITQTQMVMEPRTTSS